MGRKPGKKKVEDKDLKEEEVEEKGGGEHVSPDVIESAFEDESVVDTEELGLEEEEEDDELGDMNFRTSDEW